MDGADGEMATLTGAYAVHALGEAERTAFEEHLAGCEACAQEVRELTATAARLGEAAAAEPPPALRQRVLDEIARTRQDPPETTVVPFPARRDRSRLVTRIAVAAAVAALALATGLGVVTVRTNQQLDQAEQRLEQASERGAAMASVLYAPDAHVVHGSADGAAMTAVVSRSEGRAVLMPERMPEAPSGHVHQLWAIGPGGARSMALMPDAGGGDRQPLVAALPDGTDVLGVTVEPDGGSPQPTTDPLMSLSLRA
ncbi:anti-sigma factor [Prauserella sp. ASG 168]|uniref:Regulator of SigK n=2 Tax=Prauserella cavernicola TaxID=2800127 RepID=A0A934QW88_9PSEU|nr:anti-sigma factor [Prauserella cavernicola]